MDADERGRSPSGDLFGASLWVPSEGHFWPPSWGPRWNPSLEAFQGASSASPISVLFVPDAL